MIHDSPDLKTCKELKLLGELIYCTCRIVTIHMPQTKPAVLYFTLRIGANRAGKVASCEGEDF